MVIKARDDEFIGIVGFGRIGSAFGFRLNKTYKNIIVYDPNELAQSEARSVNISIAATLEELGEKSTVIFLLIPSGKIVDETIRRLTKVVSKATIIIDAGNSNFHDSIKNHKLLSDLGIAFLDCGTSGGVHGLKNGFCLMVGGEQVVYEALIDIFKILAVPEGYAHVGPPGAGHYVKMVHNGIEYALLQAYAEGFHLLEESIFKSLNLEQIAHLWNHGSVIRSFILELITEIFGDVKDFSSISGKVNQSGMGLWTVNAAHERKVPIKLIEDAVEIRTQSQQTGGNFATKIVALLRNKFGGHKAEGCEVCKNEIY